MTRCFEKFRRIPPSHKRSSAMMLVVGVLLAVMGFRGLLAIAADLPVKQHWSLLGDHAGAETQIPDGISMLQKQPSSIRYLPVRGGPGGGYPFQGGYRAANAYGARPGNAAYPGYPGYAAPTPTGYAAYPGHPGYVPPPTGYARPTGYATGYAPPTGYATGYAPPIGYATGYAPGAAPVAPVPAAPAYTAGPPAATVPGSVARPKPAAEKSSSARPLYAGWTESDDSGGLPANWNMQPGAFWGSFTDTEPAKPAKKMSFDKCVMKEVNLFSEYIAKALALTKGKSF